MCQSMPEDNKFCRRKTGNLETAQFQKDLESLGISLSSLQEKQFLRYYELLVEWNRVMNLTAITEYGEVIKKHFIDSLSLVKAYRGDMAVSMIDVGTGAGFPGLALKIAFPECRVTLLDSLHKRIQFLNAVIGELGLSGVWAVHGRAEDFARQEKMRESFDLCVSRAVANLSTLSEYCIPFVKVGGAFIAYKSEKDSEEIRKAEKAISLLGGNITEKCEFILPDSDISRCLFLIEKEKATPKKYPRKAGLPGKEPL